MKLLHKTGDLDYLKILVISSTDILHHADLTYRQGNSKKNIHKYARTIYVSSSSSDGLRVLDSSVRIITPASKVHKHAFGALYDSIHSVGGAQGEKVWLEAVSYFNGSRASGSRLIPNVFSPLLVSLDIQCQIEQWLMSLNLFTSGRIRSILRKDNPEIAVDLIAIFQTDDYKDDIALLSEAEATRIMSFLDLVRICSKPYLFLNRFDRSCIIAYREPFQLRNTASFPVRFNSV
ncbi:hypothetical protein BDP27DRAFT_632149 [Rhodocollybia butyracea]|uniref:Uncharacterized protein n=1 Tax=Rhodocollybia butyracea TaxID=206335 RepID=A0A9P5U8U3_9AGAR|nr:hypothetical protein BDP27DRAFT_632149 [Rhodocollybia butyracea]